MSNPSTNYFVRHWRGELSLAKSFWLNFVLLDVVTGVIGAALNKTAIPRDAQLLWVVLWLAIHIWLVVGCIRAAINHKERTGRAGLAVAAALVVAIAATKVLTNAVYAVIFLTAENPLALDSPQRQKFVRDFVGDCVNEVTAGLPREEAFKSCTCLANAFADTATASELRTAKQDFSAVRPRLTALAEKCI